MVWNQIIIKQMDNYLIKLFLTKWSYSLVQSVVGANCKRTQNISLSQSLTPSLELKLQGALVLKPSHPIRVSILSCKYSWIQITQTFLKKVWVIGSMKQLTKNKKEIKWMDGERGRKYDAHFMLRAAREINILKRKLSNKAWLIYRDGHWIWIGVT